MFWYVDPEEQIWTCKHAYRVSGTADEISFNAFSLAGALTSQMANSTSLRISPLVSFYPAGQKHTAPSCANSLCAIRKTTAQSVAVC